MNSHCKISSLSKRGVGVLGFVDVRNNQSGSSHNVQLDINENYASTSEDESLLIDLFVSVTKRNLEEEIDCLLRESTLDEYSMTQFEIDFMENMYNTGQINDCESLERCVSDFRKSLNVEVENVEYRHGGPAQVVLRPTFVEVNDENALYYGNAINLKSLGKSVFMIDL